MKIVYLKDKDGATFSPRACRFLSNLVYFFRSNPVLFIFEHLHGSSLLH